MRQGDQGGGYSPRTHQRSQFMTRMESQRDLIRRAFWTLATLLALDVVIRRAGHAIYGFRLFQDHQLLKWYQSLGSGFEYWLPDAVFSAALITLASVGLLGWVTFRENREASWNPLVPSVAQGVVAIGALVALLIMRLDGGSAAHLHWELGLGALALALLASLRFHQPFIPILLGCELASIWFLLPKDAGSGHGLATFTDRACELLCWTGLFLVLPLAVHRGRLAPPRWAVLVSLTVGIVLGLAAHHWSAASAHVIDHMFHLHTSPLGSLMDSLLLAIATTAVLSMLLGNLSLRRTATAAALLFASARGPEIHDLATRTATAMVIMSSVLSTPEKSR